MLVMPDTSPRDTGIDGADAAWDFGHGAGFYLDATQAPWEKHFRMESWITQELRDLVLSNFPTRPEKVGIAGHSMGGHGALTLALRHPDLYQSVSAIAPICAPSQCPWGEKAFGGYLGPDRGEQTRLIPVVLGAFAPVVQHLVLRVFAGIAHGSFAN